MLISDAHRQANAEMHERKQLYGTSGARWCALVHDLACDREAKTVLDYGCGRGLLKDALLAQAEPPPYTILEYDPAIPGKQEKPLRADVVVCNDVMEHVEPECVFSVLDDIRNTARSAVLFSISTVEAKKHLPDGRNAHLVVESTVWWLPKLVERWQPIVFRDFGQVFLFTGFSK